MLCDFMTFMVEAIPGGTLQALFPARITCGQCSGSFEQGLLAGRTNRLACEECGNVERGYIGIPDEFIGAPCPECATGKMRVEREADAVGRIRSLRIRCPDCDWEL